MSCQYSDTYLSDYCEGPIKGDVLHAWCTMSFDDFPSLLDFCYLPFPYCDMKIFVINLSVIRSRLRNSGEQSIPIFFPNPYYEY